MEHRRWIGASWVVASVLFGCGSGTSDGPKASSAAHETGDQASWECSMKASRVLCSAALTKVSARPPAYACAPNESADGCPDNDAVVAVQGLDARMAESGSADAFRSQPWACLVTGMHQYQCV